MMSKNALLRRTVSMLFVASITLGVSAITASSANAATPQVSTQAPAAAQPT